MTDGDVIESVQNERHMTNHGQLLLKEANFVEEQDYQHTEKPLSCG